MGFKTSKKKSAKWGQGGIVGGDTGYDQINNPKNFTVHQQGGLNRHKANVKTDKPYDAHIDGKK